MPISSMPPSNVNVAGQTATAQVTTPMTVHVDANSVSWAYEELGAWMAGFGIRVSSDDMQANGLQNPALALDKALARMDMRDPNGMCSDQTRGRTPRWWQPHTEIAEHLIRQRRQGTPRLQ